MRAPRLILLQEHPMRSIRSLALLAVVPVQLARAQAAEPVWGPAPAVFPAGAKMAVMQGDPGKPELFTVRLQMPDGYRIAPHFHPTDENITVIKGTFLIGMGDTLEPKKTKKLEAGGFATAGANMHHYAIAKGRTIVQVH